MAELPARFYNPPVSRATQKSSPRGSYGVCRERNDARHTLPAQWRNLDSGQRETIRRAIGTHRSRGPGSLGVCGLGSQRCQLNSHRDHRPARRPAGSGCRPDDMARFQCRRLALVRGPDSQRRLLALHFISVASARQLRCKSSPVKGFGPNYVATAL